MLLAGDPVLLVIAIVAVVGIMAGAWWFSPHQRVLRAIRGVPRVPIPEAVEGSIVRIVGRVRGGDAVLSAPISGRPCAHYDVLVEEYVRRGKRGHWRTVVHEIQSCDFTLEGDQGAALVRTTVLEGAVLRDHRRSSGFLNDASPSLDALLARHGRSSTGLFGMNRSLRYREGVLEPGEEVAVVGLATWVSDPEPGRPVTGAIGGGQYRESARPRRLEIRAGNSPVRVSDDPKALV
jgi:hypothetical protein